MSFVTEIISKTSEHFKIIVPTVQQLVFWLTVYIYVYNERK